MPEEIVEVAVYAEDGRSSQLATFHGWEQRDGGEWWGHVMVYGPTTGNGSGMYRDTVPAARLLLLDYCGRLPSGEIRHRCEGHDLKSHDLKVWA